MSEQICHCGQPLHYSDPNIRRVIERLIEIKGEFITVESSGRKWLVPRHYIALHGLRAADLPSLGFEEVTHEPDLKVELRSEDTPIEVGTIVEKINSEPGDGHVDGSRARVLYVMGRIPVAAGSSLAGQWGYLVAWEDQPNLPVFIAGSRIRRVTIH